MDQSTFLVFVAVAVLAGPLIQTLLVVFTKRTEDYGEFYLANRKASPTDLVDTTVMYALQVAVITLFGTWGFQFGFWVILVPLFWAAGYYVIILLLRRGHLDRFLHESNSGTIHSFIGRGPGGRMLTKIAAVATLLGVLGPAMFEADFVGTLVAKTVNATNQASLHTEAIRDQGTTLSFLFILVPAVYLMLGGFKAAVRTDRVQLIFGFVGFVLFYGFLLFKVAETERIASGALSSMSFVVVFFALICWFVVVARKKDFGKGRYVSGIVLIVSTLVFALLLANAITRGGVSGDSFQQFLMKHKFESPTALGWGTILSLLIANGLYQLVDVGHWQRLLAVDLGTSPTHGKRRAADALKISMIFSSASWMIAIFFGMTLRYLVDERHSYDEVAGVVMLLVNDSLLAQVAALVLLASLVSIMLSTVDSLIIGIAFTTHNDLVGGPKTTAAARVVTLTILFAGFVLYTLFSRNVPGAPDVLYCCWSFQIALFPAIAFTLLGKEARLNILALSIVAGMVGAVVPLFVQGWSPYTHSPPFALAASSLVSLLSLKKSDD